nr:hypothetical protein [Tanacetum cinerariifolium]
AQIRRIGYGIFDVRIGFFKFLRLSSRMGEVYGAIAGWAVWAGRGEGTRYSALCAQWFELGRHKESTRRIVPVETPASADLVSSDGLGGYDWSDQAEDGPTNFALMAYSSTSSNSEVSTHLNCSSSCWENTKILKEQNEQLLKDLRTFKINAITYKTGLKFVEARLLVYKKNESVYEEDIKILKRKIYLKEVAITELRRKLELAQKQKDEIQLTVENFENSSKILSKLLDCQIIDKFKTGLGYNTVPPPYTRNFFPPKPNLSGLEEFVNEPIVTEPILKKPAIETSEAKAGADKPKVVRKNFGPPLIEEWILDSEDEAESKPNIEKKNVKPSFAKIEFVKSKEQVKSPRKTNVKQVKKPGQNTHGTRGNQRNWNNMMSQRLGSNFKVYNKACYVCGSFDHLQANWSYHQQQFKNQKMDEGVIDSRCSRHMAGNMSYLIDYEEINGGYVAFGGKFDGKAGEGFFIGHSLNIKAFRVFNNRTRMVEENLHIRFSENTPNIARSGPNWLFDIDALTKSMNYKLVVIENQSNDNAESKSSQDDGFQPSSDDGKKVDEDIRQESECKDQEKQDNVNNTNNVNVAGTNGVNDVGANTNNELLFDPEMPALEDISTFNFLSDHEDDEEADMNNMDTTIQFSPTPTTRIHKDHPLDQVIEDLHSTTQTRTMSKNLEERSQDKYVAQIIKKYGFLKDKNASTPIETQKPLLKDKDGKEVDVHMYRSMIGSLMYLTSLRPDIMFVVCACARYQVNPKCKKQTVIANSITEAEYVAASSCCRQLQVNVVRHKLTTASFKLMLLAIVKAKTANGEGQLQDLVDGKKVLLIESTIKRDLQLEDAEGVNCLINAVIFKQLTLMGFVDEAVNEEMDDSLKRAATTASSLDAEQDRVRVESSEDEVLVEEDASKLGRIADIDVNEDITLVSTHDEQMFDVDQDLGGEEVFVAQQDKKVIEKEVDAAQIQVTTAVTTLTISIDEATLAQALAELKHAKPKAKAKGIIFHEPEESTTTTTIPKPKSQDNEKMRKFFVAKRAEEKRNKPPTQAQQRKIMCTYLKNMKEKKLIDLKNKYFDSIHKMFDRAFKRVNTFVNYRNELVEESSKKAEAKVTEDFDREDVVTLCKLVKAKYGSTRPEGDYDRMLLGDLKVMFEPHIEDEVWKMQQRYNVVRWTLFNSC